MLSWPVLTWRGRTHMRGCLYTQKRAPTRSPEPPMCSAHPCLLLLQGDSNWPDDRSLYPRGQLWLNTGHIMGKVVG